MVLAEEATDLLAAEAGADPIALNRLGELAFREHRFDLVESFAAGAFDAAIRLRIVAARSLADSEAVCVWRLSREGGEFLFDERLLTHPHIAILIKHWIQNLPLFCHFQNTYPEVAGSVAVNLEDMGHTPGLAYSDYRADFVLIPDPIFMMERAYRDHRTYFVSHAIRYEDRRPLALWRGTTTGWFTAAGQRATDWRDLPRVQLARLAKTPEGAAVLDAALTGVVQWADPEAETGLAAMGLLQTPMPWQEFQAYRYQIDIDGNSCSWPGLFTKLCTGCPVLKVASPLGFRQWYYDRLVPWVNFIPVAADMSDLIDKLGWLEGRPEVGETIGRNGQNLALSMTVESETYYAEHAILRAFGQSRF